MKKVLLLIHLLLSTLLLYPQKHPITLGLSGGTTISNIRSENYPFSGNYSNRPGVTGEFSFSMNLTPRMFIMSDIGILQKGYSYDYERLLFYNAIDLENSYSGMEYQTSHYYLNNGWYLGYQFGNQLTISVSAGVYYAYYLVSKMKDWNYVYVDPADHALISDPAIPEEYQENRTSSTDRIHHMTDWDVGSQDALAWDMR